MSALCRVNGKLMPLCNAIDHSDTLADADAADAAFFDALVGMFADDELREHMRHVAPRKLASSALRQRTL